MYGGTNIVYIVFAAIGALLVVIPLPKVMASGNVGASMLIIWTELTCLCQCANAIRWNRNTRNWAPAWCDFCAYFLIAAPVAFVGTGVSINRRLYMIVTLDPQRHRRAFNAVVDIVACLVIPLVSVALEYVVQQNRYYIYEDIGCVPGVATVDVAFPLVWMLPLFVGTISTGYACLTIRATLLLRNHKLIGEPEVDLAWRRRLMAIGILSVTYGLVPQSIFIALMATAYPVKPWPGWDAIHSTIGEVMQFSAQEWQSSAALIVSVEMLRWAFASLAFVIFFIFGLTTDVKKLLGIPRRNVIDEAFFVDQARTVSERNVSVNLDGQQPLHRHCGNCRTVLENPPSEGRGCFDSVGRPGLGSGMESVDLASPSCSRPTSSWKPYH